MSGIKSSPTNLTYRMAGLKNLAIFLDIYSYKRFCMVLNFVQLGNSLPVSYPVDFSAVFEAGMIAQLGVSGNNVVCGVSDGTCPLGVIDDYRTTAFFAPSIDEVVIAQAPAIQQGSNYVSTIDVMQVLQNSNITPSSFVTSPVDVELKPVNGAIIFPAGTFLNYDNDGDGIPDSIRTVVSYNYQIPNMPGEDTTSASGRVTVHFQRHIGQTSVFETNVHYPVNAPLFSSENGKFTTSPPFPDAPSVAIVTGPPISAFSTLEYYWL